MSRSNSSASLHEPPIMPPASPGSSVSTLQEEYDELLKYAVVVPRCDPRGFPGIMVDTRPHTPPTGDKNKSSKIGSGKTGSDKAENSKSRKATKGTTKHRKSSGERREKVVSDSEPEKNPGVPEHSRNPAAGSPSVQQLPDFDQSPVSGRSPRSMRDQWSKDFNITNGYPLMFPERTEGGFSGGGISQPSSKSVEHTQVDKVYTSTMDPDVARMETLLDQWCLELKRNVLAEFSQAKMRVVTIGHQDLKREREKFAVERVESLRELDSIKELMNTSDETLKRKDSVISNLTTAMHRNRDKMELQRKFGDWKAQFSDTKREAFATKLAHKHYIRTLCRKVFAAWFSTIQGKWRQHVEKACQTKAQEVCLQLTGDYEAKIAALNEAQDTLGKEIQRLHTEREQYEEAMKKAFMRGVCALNMEAMNMFHDDNENDNKQTDRGNIDVNFSNNVDVGVTHKVVTAAKVIPHDLSPPTASQQLPTKIVTSQGSRSSQTTALPRQSFPKPSSTSSAVSSNKPRVTSGHAPNKAGEVTRPAGRPVSPVLHPPMASVIVERHQPVTKQTIGHATASKFPKTSTDSEKFRRIAGQNSPTKIPPHIHTVRMVE